MDTRMVNILAVDRSRTVRGSSGSVGRVRGWRLLPYRNETKRECRVLGNAGASTSTRGDKGKVEGGRGKRGREEGETMPA
jgi:hypothetical protein